MSGPGTAEAAGAARLEEVVRGARVLLLGNAAAVDGEGRTTRARVEDAGPAALTLLVPEHGYRAALPPGETDSAGVGRVPFHAMGVGAPTPALPEADVELFDLPLVGARYFTYLDGLRRLGEVAARRGRGLVVQDRPNPLGALREGPGVAPELRSEVAALDVPVRYGWSTGALAREVARGEGWPEPVVLPAAPGVPFVPPSPNLREPAAVAMYPATCLLEALEVSVGRGTERPFLRLGAPGIDGEALASRLAPPPEVSVTPTRFRPAAGTRRGGEDCEGVDLAMDLGAGPPGPRLPLGLQLLQAFRELLPGEDPWVRDGRGVPWIDRLWGSDALTRARLAGRDLRTVETAPEAEKEATHVQDAP